MIPPRIREYIDFVRSAEHPVCREQLQLADLVARAFREESLRYDEAQAERYLGQQRHFPFRLTKSVKICVLASSGNDLHGVKNAREINAF